MNKEFLVQHLILGADDFEEFRIDLKGLIYFISQCDINDLIKIRKV